MLRACLQEQYDLVPATIDFLPLGQDMNAGVYRVLSEQGTPYLLKIKSGSFYTPKSAENRAGCGKFPPTCRSPGAITTG